MGRKKKVEALSLTLTAQRAARLYRLLTLLEDGPQTRQQLLRRLRIDIRGFYRDLESLRELGIEILTDDNRYGLLGKLEDALARLPFPDPGLNFRDVQQLAKGDTAAHRKLKQRINSFLNTGWKPGHPNKPR
jgi:biotin operon repressor